MRPDKWSRRNRRRAAIVAVVLAAIGALAAGTHAAMATEVVWGYSVDD